MIKYRMILCANRTVRGLAHFFAAGFSARISELTRLADIGLWCYNEKSLKGGILWKCN